ncbi:MAG TPA: TIGR04282 family arsenosugar biosynthesis glycosyltransferase [Pirellulales bacterium]|nr:TIGR04282 family arsenosugar biosynthesis glycosyltransferase [Pirellulales bacterium]
MRQLGVFAKYWRPGTVKTRLAASIGPEAAACLHRACVRTVITRTCTMAARRALVVAPPESLAEFARFAGAAWNVESQSSGDLGERMRRFFEASFARGASEVVLIGSDSPTLPLEYIERAFELLGRHPVVVGPACDGGYYLIGAMGKPPPVFDGVAWGSDAVWRQTVERLTAAGCSHAELPRWYDIDTIDDLRRLHAELSAMNPRDQAYEALWREVVGQVSNLANTALCPKVDHGGP